MAFTTLEILRTHIITAGEPEFDIRDFRITLSGEENFELPHINLLELSETVKWLSSPVPALYGPITLTDFDPSSIGDSNLVPQSSVVTLSENLETLYAEEKDYRIDYADGKIYRTAGTTIPNGQPVYVYCVKYDLFTRDTDYEIDYETGTIHRLDSGDIPDNATVLIDYTVNEGSVDDAMLEQAIVEANDIVVRALSAEYSASSTDQGLKTGTTQLALSIFARLRAAEGLIANRASDSHSRAREWQNLSTFYEKKAWETLAPFLDAHMLRSPWIQ